MIKLLKASNSLKETLSANKESPFFVESLFDGEDLRSRMSRSTFEKLNIEAFESIIRPIEQVLAEANLTLEQIDRVELVGGVARVPKVQEIL